MHDVIKHVKDAVMEKAPDGSPFGQYVFYKDIIYAQNQELSAAAPLGQMLGVDFNIAASSLEAILARMENPPVVSCDGQHLTLHSGRIRKANIAVLPATSPPAAPQGSWHPIPAALGAALRQAAPFVGENGWAQGIRLSNGKVTAIAPQHGIDIDVPGLVISTPVLLTVKTAEFLVDHTPLEEMAIEGDPPTGIAFRWRNGRWFKAQLLNATMPSRVDELFSEQAKSAFLPITQEVRDSYLDAASMSDGTVELVPEGWIASKGTTTEAYNVDVACITMLPAGHKSRWQRRALDAVMEVATEFAPGDWPAPCRFRAKGIRGMVLGVN